jgi:hypothetical protein
MLRNGILSCCLFRGMVGNRIPSVCLYYCSTKRNSELFSLPRNGSEQNSECLLLILFHGTEFRAVFFSAERFGMENFLFRGTAGIPPEQNNCSVYSVFRGIIFLWEIANPSTDRSICSSDRTINWTLHYITPIYSRNHIILKFHYYRAIIFRFYDTWYLIKIFTKQAKENTLQTAESPTKPLVSFTFSFSAAYEK